MAEGKLKLALLRKILIINGFRKRIIFQHKELPLVRQLIAMKKNIHPEYIEAQISCACGNTFTTHNTVGDLKVDVCSACHPLFTGKQKFVDTAGRIDRFKKRYGVK